MEIHGSWKFKLCGSDSLLVKVKGAWNEEAAIAFSEEFKRHVSSLVGKPWVILISTRDGELMVPESLKVLEDLNRWVISHHYVREASIVGYRIHKEVFKKTRAQLQSEYTQASFDDLNDALTFLADSDYPIQLSLYEVESWFNSY